MLGSNNKADDAVQEAWLRLSRTDADAVENLGGWLTTVVSRVCLDMLRSPIARREVPPEGSPDPAISSSPEDEAVLADSIGLALLVVLDTLTPAERLAFVLHDLFAVSFEEIAPIVDRTPVAARQLASRARRRVQSDPTSLDLSASTQREVVTAFLAAARDGNFAALIQLLDPDVILRADAVAIGMAKARADAGAPELAEQIRGVDAVVRVFAGGAKAAKLSLVDGLAGAVVSVGGRLMAVFDFTVSRGRVVSIEVLSDPETLSAIDLAPVLYED
jgi:RNA polymerase sigma-70 factor (ECF subfamily)